MQNTGVHEFTLNDRNGNPHHYVVTLTPAGEGMAIMYDLIALGAPTLLGLAGAAVKSEQILGAIVQAFSGAADGPATGQDAAELAKMVGELDLGTVGAELGRALAMGKAPELTRKVLAPARVHRDGKPLNIDLAYQANYGEMLQAVWKVCSLNGFFPVPSMSLGSSGATEGQSTPSPGS